MRALIAYASRYGTTELCARQIGEAITCPSDLVDLKGGRQVSPSRYDVVIIGGPIYGGKIMAPVTRFVESHSTELRKKIVGLFICCLYEGERAEEELTSNYPPWLLAHAAAKNWLGGRVTVSRLRLLDRWMVTRVADVSQDIDRIQPARVAELAKRIDAAVSKAE